ncbi:MAG: serine/threonine protein kinase, partial [Mycobacterium sp.]
NPAASGPVPHALRPPPPAPRPRRSHVAPMLVIATVLLFGVAALLAAILVSGSDTGGSEPGIAAPSPSSPASTPEQTTTAEATGIAGVSGTDSQGFIGHTARCEEGTSPVAAIRTASSLAVICEDSSGDYSYRGERLRDGANLQLDNAKPSRGGFEARNPADGARYRVEPDMLTISSNGRVDSAEPALEYGTG